MSVYDDQSLVLNKHQHSGSIPQHVAVIMDGNRRWAIERNESIYEGHRKGADTLKKIIEITFLSHFLRLLITVNLSTL